MEGVDDIINYLLTSRILALYSRSKYTIKLYSGSGKVKYIQCEQDIFLIDGEITFHWTPVDEKNGYLSYLPLERVLEIDIETVTYNEVTQEFVIDFKNGCKLILKDDNFEGVFPIYEINNDGF